MCLNLNVVVVRRRKISEVGEMKYIFFYMLNFLFASKNCINAFLNVFVNFVLKIKVNLIYVKFVLLSDVINVLLIIIVIVMVILVCYLFNLVRYKMKNNIVGDSVLIICKNDSVRWKYVMFLSISVVFWKNLIGNMFFIYVVNVILLCVEIFIVFVTCTLIRFSVYS